MNAITKYLIKLRNAIYKLLPMFEDAIEGADNCLLDYLDSIISNAKGGMVTFPRLNQAPRYICVINDLNFLATNKVSYEKFRKVILKATRRINDLSKLSEAGDDYGFES